MAHTQAQAQATTAQAVLVKSTFSSRRKPKAHLVQIGGETAWIPHRGVASLNEVGPGQYNIVLNDNGFTLFNKNKKTTAEVQADFEKSKWMAAPEANWENAKAVGFDVLIGGYKIFAGGGSDYVATKCRIFIPKNPKCYNAETGEIANWIFEKKIAEKSNINVEGKFLDFFDNIDEEFPYEIVRG